MSAAVPLSIIVPNLAEPWYAKPFRFANLPKAAEKVWACLKFESFRRRSTTLTISDRFGSQWCSAHLGIHVGRRCFQKGLKQLEDIGAIVRHRSRGRRAITITVNLAGPKPKPARTKAPARKGKPATAATAAAPTAPTPPAPPAPEPPPATPEECRQAAETLRALVAQVHAQEEQQAAGSADPPEPPPPAPTPRSSPRRPRLAIPDAIRREIDEKERRRRADELARLQAIPDEQRSDDQRRRLNALAAALGEPGVPPAPSGP